MNCQICGELEGFITECKVCGKGFCEYCGDHEQRV
jgi:predicted nucleic acid binding AN1-type Zn finger protein